MGSSAFLDGAAVVAVCQAYCALMRQALTRDISTQGLETMYPPLLYQHGSRSIDPW
jgi:hypothetical protein